MVFCLNSSLVSYIYTFNGFPPDDYQYFVIGVKTVASNTMEYIRKCLAKLYNFIMKTMIRYN